MMNAEDNKQPEAASESNKTPQIEYSKLGLEEKRLETDSLLKLAELKLKAQDQRINKLQIWIPVITVVLSVISSIIASVITFRTTIETKNIDSDTQIRLAQNQYDFSREERKEKRLSENIPKLLSSNEDEKKTAKAIIVFFYPSDAEKIFNEVAATASESQQSALRLDPKQVEAINNQSWGIVISADADLPNAQWEAQQAKDKAKNQEYDLVRIFHRQNYFRTVIGAFSDKELAERANISVSAKIRDSSYVVDLNTWCPNATKGGDGNNEYWQCSSK
jgi:SPOR domain